MFNGQPSYFNRWSVSYRFTFHGKSTIEYGTYYGYMNDNLSAYDYLSSDGVDVKLDNETDIVHLKFVLIDDETMKSCA